MLETLKNVQTCLTKRTLLTPEYVRLLGEVREMIKKGEGTYVDKRRPEFR